MTEKALCPCCHGAREYSDGAYCCHCHGTGEIEIEVSRSPDNAPRLEPSVSPGLQRTQLSRREKREHLIERGASALAIEEILSKLYPTEAQSER